MSVSLYKYTPACDGQPCPGDCDVCRKAQLSEEDATFNTENVEPNATQDAQGVGSVGDYISRQAAIDAINHICPVDTEYDCTLLDRVDVRCVLSDLPSEQPEIIRCKDCRWWDKYGNYDNGYCMAAKHGYWSEHWEIRIRRTYKGDFYCADAEPKEEQEDG